MLFKCIIIIIIVINNSNSSSSDSGSGNQVLYSKALALCPKVIIYLLYKFT